MLINDLPYYRVRQNRESRKQTNYLKLVYVVLNIVRSAATAHEEHMRVSSK